MHPVLLDAAGHRRQPVTLPGYHVGRPPRNKGRRYPADPPTVEEIIAVMRTAGTECRWRAAASADRAVVAGRIADRRSARAHRDRPRPPPRRRADPPRQRRQAPRGRDGQLGVGTARTLAAASRPASRRSIALRDPRPDGRARWDQASARRQLAPTAAAAGVRRRFAPHQLRHAHAVELAHEEIPLVVIQRQLGHAHLGVTSVYLQGIDSSEIIDTVHARRPPQFPATAGLRRSL